MSDDFENIIQWDVHTDTQTPQLDIKDPLSQFSEERLQSSSPTSVSSLNGDNKDLAEVAVPQLPAPVVSTSQVEPQAMELDEREAILPMTITVDEPKKHNDPTQGTYVTYLVMTQATELFKNPTKPSHVRRRFQDFVWLHTALTLEYPACIVPPLPDKHRFEYIKGDRFSNEFISKRKLSLQWFLDRISKHTILQRSQSVRVFLESNDFRSDKRAHLNHIPPPNTLMGSIGDTLVNAFTRLKKPDERFEEMKDMVNRLEENLNTVERLYMRINKRQRDLQKDYVSFANSIQGLSALETNIKKTLHQFSETCKAYSKAMKEMSEKEELLFLNEIHELLAYCYAAKDVLKARDQKQLDFEELSRYLDQAAMEKERILHPKFNDRTNIAEYVTDKINEVRGISTQQARREKLSRLEIKIKELQEEVAKANDESHEFSIQVVKEFGFFQRTKVVELKQGLLAYADCHIGFYQKGISTWESILPVLENMDSVKGDSETVV